MGKKSYKKRFGVVYSTDPDFSYDTDVRESSTPEKSSQRLRIRMEKKGRGGKIVTIVTGFIGQSDDLKDLSRELKNYCGSGGSVKEGEIIIQGDCRQKVIDFLLKSGYKDVK